VHEKNSDGSTTVIGMRVHIAAGHGTEAATISIASVTCAPAPTTPTHASSPTRSHTVKPTPHQHAPADHHADRDDDAAAAAAAAAAQQTSPAPARTPATTYVPVTG
jgi:hypothetical protein